MKTNHPLTIGQLKKWCIINHIPDNTPIGIYLGDSERGSVAFGIVGDTESEYNDDYYVINLTETTGEHCYFKNIRNIFDEAESDQIIMITDGYHSEDV